MVKQYDVVVLGAGNAGQAAAGAARKAGWSVAIVEALDVGGVCPNRGCVPKKVFVAAAEALDTVQRAHEHHIEVGDARLNWAKLFDRKESFVKPLPGAMEDSLESRGIDVFHGRGVFVDRTTIEVNDERLEGKHVVVATGSRPRPLDFEGAELLWTSDDILSMTEPPRSIVFAGAGVVALEFAHVLRRVGTEVTILEAMPRPLLRADKDVVAALVEHSEAVGIRFYNGIEIKSVEDTERGLRVVFVHNGKTVELETERAVNGAGRVANLDVIGIENAGIALERGRVQLDVRLRSIANPNVWIAGDAIPGAPQLSPVATYEGRIVGHNILNPGAPRFPDYSALPSAVYTIPTLAQVGLTEEQATAQGINIDVKATDMRGWLSSRTYNEQVAFSKVLVDKDSDLVVGAHLLGHDAGEVIHLFALAMRHGITANELGSGLFAYPTFTNDARFLL